MTAARSITISTFCSCGGSMQVTSSDAAAVLDIAARFDALHVGEGHVLFPSAAEAKRAAVAS